MMRKWKRCILFGAVLAVSIGIVSAALAKKGEEVEKVKEIKEVEKVEKVKEPEPEVWMLHEVVAIEDVDAFLEIVSADPVPLARTIHKRLRIAMIFPSLDLSDAWFCGWMGMEGRLKELNIMYELTTMGGGHADHALQASHIDLAIAQRYDYVIIAATELFVQKAAVQRMIEAGINVIQWNNNTPFKEWGRERYPDGLQPLAWVGFDHGYGGKMMGEYALTRLEPGSQIAIMYGVPGIGSELRGGTAARIMEAAGHEIVYEHYADWDKTKAYEGTKYIMTAYPEVDHIHSCSTAMTYGIIAALKELGLTGQVLVNGWGGGRGEQAHMWEGEMNFSVMRMQDDWGVALAEIIKYDLEGRRDEIPLSISGSMTIIDDTWTKAEVGKLTEYAYRYSGVVEY